MIKWKSNRKLNWQLGAQRFAVFRRRHSSNALENAIELRDGSEARGEITVQTKRLSKKFRGQPKAVSARTSLDFSMQSLIDVQKGKMMGPRDDPLARAKSVERIIGGQIL